MPHKMQFSLTCNLCGNAFNGTSGAQTTCESCRACIQCGKPSRLKGKKFCGNECSYQWNRSHPNSGTFKPGTSRSYQKICDRCGLIFASASGSRKRCHSCCKCLNCGSQMKNASHDFCSMSCSGKFNYRNSPKVRAAIMIGLTDPAMIQSRLEKAIERFKAARGKPRLNMRGESYRNGSD